MEWLAVICEKEDAVEDEDEPSSSSLAEAREMTSSVGRLGGGDGVDGIDRRNVDRRETRADLRSARR
jgi:hypothetical protein